MGTTVQRRLAAIMVADVVGYSRLMETDEAGTLAALNERRKAILDPVVRAHSGRIVKLMGDGVLVEFASAVKAAEAAIELQVRFASTNESLPADRQILLRIGINLGDVIGEGSDIYGEGVNIAARLEALAKPGGVCVSAKVHDEIRGKIAARFEDLGEQSLKNIAVAVRVYRLLTGDAMPEVQALTLPSKPSIAVLPFQNMSGDPEQEYFADGIVEDVITALSRMKWLFVIARNSSFTYKGRAVDVKQVGRELGVRYVLEGSVRRAADRVRITGQLIDAATGAHLWAERFDGSLQDIFDLQDRLTSSVVGAISPALLKAEAERVKPKPPQSLDAWECCARGMSLYSQHSEESTGEALAILDRAIELDPNYAQAIGLRAVCLAWRAVQGWEDRGHAFAAAAEAANRAIACDPHEPWAHLGRGFVAAVNWRVPEAIEAISRAIDENPNFAWAHGLLGAVHAIGGQPDMAIPYIDLAVRLSPRDIFGEEYELYYSFAHFQAGRYDEAVNAAERAIRQRPGHAVPYIIAAASYGLIGKSDRAGAVIAELVRLVPQISTTDIETNFVYSSREDRERVARGLRAGGLV